MSTTIKNVTPLESYNLSYKYFGLNFFRIENFSIVDDLISNNIPGIDFSPCLETLRKKYGGDKDFYAATVNFDGNLLSQITNTTLNSSSIYGSIYDSTKTIYGLEDCEKLEISFPDPVIHSISEDNLNKIKSLNVNYYNQSDPFYNDRCLDFSDETKEIDITIEQRRRSYMSEKSISCFNYLPDSIYNTTDCSFVGLSSAGRVICSCIGQYAEFSISEFTSRPLKGIYQINLDVMGCPLRGLELKYPFKNAGIIYTLTFIFLFFSLVIVFCFCYNDNYLVKNHHSTLKYNDSITNGKEFNSSDLEQSKPNSSINENSRAGFNIMETEKDKINNVIVFNTDFKRQVSNQKLMLRDYYRLSFNDRLTKDDRSFLKYFWDQLSNNHILILTFYKKSLLTSPVIRVVIFSFYVNALFIINAMCYTDDLIEMRSHHSQEVNIFKKSYRIIGIMSGNMK
jgi:hypothetical protein